MSDEKEFSIPDLFGGPAHPPPNQTGRKRTPKAGRRQDACPAAPSLSLRPGSHNQVVVRSTPRTELTIIKQRAMPAETTATATTKPPRTWPTCWPSLRSFKYSGGALILLVLVVAIGARPPSLADIDLTKLDARSARLFFALLAALACTWFGCAWIKALDGTYSPHTTTKPTGTFHRWWTGIPVRAAAIILPLAHLLFAAGVIYCSIEEPKYLGEAKQQIEEYFLGKAPTPRPKPPKGFWESLLGQ